MIQHSTLYCTQQVLSPGFCNEILVFSLSLLVIDRKLSAEQCLMYLVILFVVDMHIHLLVIFGFQSFRLTLKAFKPAFVCILRWSMFTISFLK